ncbi:MAG TPA: hypothetical protein VKZ18_24800 [Polyangia bacterium]|nr:hypothetical protein [Polyangia bacterium]
MPSPYTGTPGSTQAPSGPPAAGSPPIVNLPIDSDPPNAATFAQGYKVLADFVAFLQSPFGNSAAQNQPVLAAQCARLLKRAGFDHRGFLGGNLSAWHEDWINVGAVTKTSGSGNYFGRWRYSANAIAGNATIQVGAPTGSADVCPWLELSGATGQGAAVVEAITGFQGFSGGGIDMVMEFLWRFDAINVASSFAAGIFDGSLVGLVPTGTFESINPRGFGIYLPSGGTGNFLAYSNLTGTPATPVDTGIAATTATTYRIRLELQAPATSDNTAARLLAYINGNAVADIAPGSLPNVSATPAFYAHDNAPTPGVMRIGAPRGAFALVPGNLFT